MLKWIVLFGWVLVITGGILIVEFPSAGWNHAASEILWMLSIAVFIATFTFVLMTAVRLITRLIDPPKRLPTAVEQITAQPAPKTRWRRKLFLGSGAIIGIAALVVALLTFIEHETKSSDVYRISITRAEQSRDIATIVGLPIKPGWLVTGEITESTDGTGRARLGIPLDGPRGGGTLHVQAQRRAGNWRLYVLQFVSADKTSEVDLLSSPPPSTQPHDSHTLPLP